MAALTWSPADGALYAIAHGRTDQTSKSFPNAVTPDLQDDNISDEMIKVTKGTDFELALYLWDGAQKQAHHRPGIYRQWHHRSACRPICRAGGGIPHPLIAAGSDVP